MFVSHPACGTLFWQPEQAGTHPLGRCLDGSGPRGRGGLLGEELPSHEAFMSQEGLRAAGSGLCTTALSTARPHGSPVSQAKDWGDYEENSAGDEDSITGIISVTCHHIKPLKS